LISFFVAAAFGQQIPALGPKEAFEMLKSLSVKLVDVRSVAEYVLVGHPVQAHSVPFTFWDEAEARFVPNPDFAKDLKERFKPEETLIFICRSGERSRRSAEAARAAGFPKTFNIGEGFEGGLDASGRRTIGGWKNAGLPWTYDIDPQLAHRAKRR
jgi:rhodanese-related sulfurtransferase